MSKVPVSRKRQMTPFNTSLTQGPAARIPVKIVDSPIRKTRVPVALVDGAVVGRDGTRYPIGDCGHWVREGDDCRHGCSS